MKRPIRSVGTRLLALHFTLSSAFLRLRLAAPRCSVFSVTRWLIAPIPIDPVENNCDATHLRTSRFGSWRTFGGAARWHMWAARLRIVLAAAALLATLPGCAMLPSDRPVTVLVRDAETQKPIVAAEVTIACPLTKSFTGSSIARATTEAEGLARLRAAPFSDSVTMMQVAAPGYLEETKELALESIAAIDPPGWFEPLDRRPPNFTVDLYAAPRPQVELTLPVGFRGPIRVRTEIEIAETASIRQRRFSYPVSASGDAVVVGPALLRQLLASDGAGMLRRTRRAARPQSEGRHGRLLVAAERDRRRRLLRRHGSGMQGRHRRRQDRRLRRTIVRRRRRPWPQGPVVTWRQVFQLADCVLSVRFDSIRSPIPRPQKNRQVGKLAATLPPRSMVRSDRPPYPPARSRRIRSCGLRSSDF